MIDTPLLVKERLFVVAVEDTKTFPTNEPENQCIHFPFEERFQRFFLATVPENRLTILSPIYLCGFIGLLSQSRNSI